MQVVDPTHLARPVMMSIKAVSCFNAPTSPKHTIFPSHRCTLNRGIKHDFPFINTCKVLREVLKTEGKPKVFNTSRGTLRMLMNNKIMFDHYYCINSTKKHCKNEENIGTLYFITASHFPTRVCFKKYA